VNRLLSGVAALFLGFGLLLCDQALAAGKPGGSAPSPAGQARPAGAAVGGQVRPTTTVGGQAQPVGAPGAPFFGGQTQPAGAAIGPGDVLQITVYLQPDLSQEVRVGEQGYILLPLIGQVAAAGQGSEALARTLTARYTEFLVNPQVTGFVKEYQRREITVAILGEVRGPGRYRVPEHTTILDLISQVGGLTEESGGRVIVLRSVSTAQTRDAEAIIVNAQELFTPGGLKAQNIELNDGDTVHVPRADHYYVFGEVARPGAYKLEKGTSIDIMKAIGLAGGFTEKAARSGVKLTREIEGRKSVFKVNMATEVRSQDIIVVPESFF